MTDYDGEDALKTYLNGLTWATLTEPTYQIYFERQTTEITNVVILHQTGITPLRLNKDEYILQHHINLYYINDTKAKAWPNLKYILVSLWQLTDSDSHYEIGEVSMQQTPDRKQFTIQINYSEILTM